MFHALFNTITIVSASLSLSVSIPRSSCWSNVFRARFRPIFVIFMRFLIIRSRLLISSDVLFPPRAPRSAAMVRQRDCLTEDRKKIYSILTVLLLIFPIVDFFCCNTDGKEPLRNDIWYHFKEGYSNAVRRNVKISDFI